MARQDAYLDAMLRHLGAAYYESLHGRATLTDLSRALDTVEEHLGEHEPGPGTEDTAAPGQGNGQRPARRPARKVRDVMTTAVVTVDRATTYKEIAGLLSEHGLSGLPVLMMGRRVAGVVTESDLLDAQEKTVRRVREAGASRWRLRPRGAERGGEHQALTADELMTSPAITIGPGATLAAAARLMNAHHVRRLPVVSQDGVLVGIVSRRDLLRVFLRPDAEIAADARQVLREFSRGDPPGVTVAVRGGVVTISGTLAPAPGQAQDLTAVAIRLIRDIDGVVDVLIRPGAEEAPSARPAQPAGT